MKLRNKKTGEVVDLSIFGISLSIRKTEQPRAYHSLADLNAEWEDYEPVEPRIKDERIRKTVRAWAEINSIEEVIYAERTDKSLFVLTDMGDDDTNIEFVGWVPTLKDGGDYSIAALCGDSKEEE